MKEYRGIYDRIQAFIAGFDFKVVHRKGSCQQNADSLSRMKGLEDSASPDPLVVDEHLQDVDDIYAIVPAVSQNELQDTIERDSTLKRVKDYVMTQHKPSSEERKDMTLLVMEYVNIFEC